MRHIDATRRRCKVSVGTRVCDRILIMVQFFKVCSAYQIPILILNNERTSYVSRSSFVSQYQIGSCHSTWSESVIASEAIAQHIVPADTVPVFFREGPRAVPAKGLRRRQGEGGRGSPRNLVSLRVLCHCVPGVIASEAKQSPRPPLHLLPSAFCSTNFPFTISHSPSCSFVPACPRILGVVVNIFLSLK